MAPRANRGDLVILGKVDVIPRTDTLEALRGCHFETKNDCAILEESTFQYSYSNYVGSQPEGPKVLSSEVTQPALNPFAKRVLSPALLRQITPGSGLKVCATYVAAGAIVQTGGNNERHGSGGAQIPGRVHSKAAGD